MLCFLFAFSHIYSSFCTLSFLVRVTNIVFTCPPAINLTDKLDLLKYPDISLNKTYLNDQSKGRDLPQVLHMHIFRYGDLMQRINH